MKNESIILVSEKEAFDFMKEYFKNPGDLRLGQAFCNKFNIADNTLFYETNKFRASEYIYRNYVKYE